MKKPTKYAGQRTLNRKEMGKIEGRAGITGVFSAGVHVAKAIWKGNEIIDHMTNRTN